MDLKSILLTGGVLFTFVGALLLIGQVALARRYKEISGGFNLRTSVPGLMFLLLGLALLFSFWTK